MRKTKIVCTIGPASESREVLTRIIAAGMDVARLNFSHGTHEEHANKIKLIREIAASQGRAVAILQDLAGPKIRTGAFACGTITLKSGDEFILTSRDVPGDEKEVSLTYRDLPKDVQPGDTLLLSDGALEMRVESVTNTDIHCQVLVGGELSSHKGINLPSRSIRAPILTKKDYDDFAFGLSLGVDYVALSFVRSAKDIEVARAYMRAQGINRPLIAKIEKHEALADLDNIIDAVDGLMVARGDLGVDIPLERVPNAQRTIISKANLAGKPVITATQMLKSMTDAPRPTRAEVTDVSNAILEGTDAIMLSEETAAGSYPVEAVKTMAKIAEEAEKDFGHQAWFYKLAHTEPLDDADAVSRTAAVLGGTIKAKALLCATQTGASVRQLSKCRPKLPIFAGTSDPDVFRQLALIWGVVPMMIPEVYVLMELFEEMHLAALRFGMLHRGDTVIMVAGYPLSITGQTNMIKVEKVP